MLRDAGREPPHLPPAPDRRRGLPERLARGLIRGYQLSVSSLLGRQCRFLPTCSDYADEAIARHGLWRGGLIGAARICRCHPWGGSGYDPVPTRLPNALSPLRLLRAARQERASNCADRP